MNKIKKRLLSCVLCATGGLNLNAKALSSTPEQKKSETSVARDSDRKYSQEGGIFSFRTLVEVMLLGCLSHDKYQNYKKNKTDTKQKKDKEIELTNKNQELVQKENELNQLRSDLKKLDENLKLQISEFNKKQQNFTNQENQLKLDQKKFTEESKKTVLGAAALYTFLSNILEKNISDTESFSQWKNFDEKKRELEFADFGGWTYGVTGYLKFGVKKVDDWQKAVEFCDLIDDLNVGNLEGAKSFSKKRGDFYPRVLTGNFYGNCDGAREIFTKYIRMASQPYCIICKFYYACPSEYKHNINPDKVFCVFAIGNVVSKKK